MDDVEEHCPQCGCLEKPPLDDRLLGYWRVCTVDRSNGRMVRMLLAEPGDVIEFTADSHLVWWGKRPPAWHGCGAHFSAARYCGSR
jgi:hypothetical protein